MCGNPLHAQKLKSLVYTETEKQIPAPEPLNRGHVEQNPESRDFSCTVHIESTILLSYA